MSKIDQSQCFQYKPYCTLQKLSKRRKHVHYWNLFNTYTRTHTHLYFFLLKMQSFYKENNLNEIVGSGELCVGFIFFVSSVNKNHNSNNSSCNNNNFEISISKFNLFQKLSEIYKIRIL